LVAFQLTQQSEAVGTLNLQFNRVARTFQQLSRVRGAMSIVVRWDAPAHYVSVFIVVCIQFLFFRFGEAFVAIILTIICFKHRIFSKLRIAV
jgi:hypothetical protein